MNQQLKLWFFRDLTDDQRLKLIGLFGLPVAEIGNNHGRQQTALQFVVKKLIADFVKEVTRAPAEHAVGGAFIKSMSPEQLRIHEALCDSQYIAGAKAGWNAGCIADPNEAQAQFLALIKSREGHLEGYADARAALSTPEAEG